MQWKCYHQCIYHISHVLSVFSQTWFYFIKQFFDNLYYLLCFLLQEQENPGKPGLISRIFDIFFSLLSLFSLVRSSDPLRSGQGCRHPLQHHRSRRWSAPQRHLQHRPHQRQHVCHPTPGQRGESLLPRKEEMTVSVLSPCFTFPSMYVCLIISQLSQWKCALPFASSIYLSFYR